MFWIRKINHSGGVKIIPVNISKYDRSIRDENYSLTAKYTCYGLVSNTITIQVIK